MVEREVINDHIPPENLEEFKKRSQTPADITANKPLHDRLF